MLSNSYIHTLNILKCVFHECIYDILQIEVNQAEIIKTYDTVDGGRHSVAHGETSLEQAIQRAIIHEAVIQQGQGASS